MKKEAIIIDFKWFKDIFIWIKIIFNPDYLIMNYSYSKEWDKELNDLMDRYDFIGFDYSDCTCFLGGVEIWIANHPYASFTKRNVEKKRPSRKTIYRAYEKLKMDRIKNKSIEPLSVNEYLDLVCMTASTTTFTVGDGNLIHVRGSNVDELNHNSMLMMTGVKDIGNGIPSNWENEID